MDAWKASLTRVHRVFGLPGLNVFAVMPDLMHVKWLGTDMYGYGSVLWLLCYRILGDDDPAKNCATVFGLLVEYWRDNQVSDRYSTIRPSMFCNQKKLPSSDTGAFPKLKGRAAEVKRLGPALLFAWTRFMDAGSVVHHQVRLMIQKSCEFDELISASELRPKMPRRDAAKAKDLLFDYCGLYAALAMHFLSPWSGEVLKLFDVTIKQHYLLHFALTIEHWNPKLGWCFAGEDLMFHIKTLCAACCRGNGAGQVVGKMMVKYRHGMHFTFDKHGSFFAHQ